MDLFGLVKTGLAQCLVDAPPSVDDDLTIGSSVFDDLYSYPDCKLTSKRRVGDSDFLVHAHQRNANAREKTAEAHQSHAAQARSGEDLQVPELKDVSQAFSSSSHVPASDGGEQQSRQCEDLARSPSGVSQELLGRTVGHPATVTDRWLECEQWAMMAEDSAASCWREVSNRSRAQSLADSSCDEDENLGRIILDARLTCKDAGGVDTLLEQDQLRLHLCQRNVDAARHFLEEQNCLKPAMVWRYLGPLAAWLDRHVASATTFPKGGLRVAGDLDAIERETRLHET